MILTESEKLYSNIEYGFDRKFAWRQSTSFYSQSFGFVQVPVTRKQDRRVVWTSLWFLSLTLFLGLIYIFELNILLSFFLWFCFAFQKEKRRFGIRISGWWWSLWIRCSKRKRNVNHSFFYNYHNTLSFKPLLRLWLCLSRTAGSVVCSILLSHYYIKLTLVSLN